MQNSCFIKNENQTERGGGDIKGESNMMAIPIVYVKTVLISITCIK